MKATATQRQSFGSKKKNKWFGMKFEFHGFWGCFAFFVTTLAILYPSSYAVPILPVLAMIFTQILAYHALTLLDQVPHQTVIVKPNWVVAPHREAFRRTIAMMGYANIRLLGQVVMQSNILVDYPFRYIHYMLLARSWYQFNPLSSNFYNGNTYIFVLPMFVGVTLDLSQFLYLPKHDLVSMSHLLGVQVAAMVMAFAFTLAFRGILNVQDVYWGAAFGVAMLFGTGWWLIFAVGVL